MIGLALLAMAAGSVLLTGSGFAVAHDRGPVVRVVVAGDAPLATSGAAGTARADAGATTGTARTDAAAMTGSAATAAGPAPVIAAVTDLPPTAGPQARVATLRDRATGSRAAPRAPPARTL